METSHHYRWRTAKFRPMLGVQGLWAGRIFIVPHMLWHGASVFPVSSEGPPHSVASLIWHMRGCGGSILTRILMTLNVGHKLQGWIRCLNRSIYRSWVTSNVSPPPRQGISSVVIKRRTVYQQVWNTSDKISINDLKPRLYTRIFYLILTKLAELQLHTTTNVIT
jgi:hypothetical protein